jgi:hypothetical protein
LTSRCLHSTVVSASALVVMSFHTVPFPFKRGVLDKLPYSDQASLN